MPVNTIEVGKRSLYINYGMRACREIADMQKMSVQELGEKLPAMVQEVSLDKLVDIMWIGVKHGYRIQRIEMDFVKDDLYDMLDAESEKDGSGPMLKALEAVTMCVEGFFKLFDGMKVENKEEAPEEKK